MSTRTEDPTTNKGTWAERAAALGLKPSTLRMRESRAAERAARAAAPKAPKAKAAPAPAQAPDFSALADTLRALMAAQQQQGEALARLLTQTPDPILVQPVPVERPLPKPSLKGVQPFGEHGPVLKPVRGIHSQRRPNVIAPVSSVRRLTIVKGDAHVTGGSEVISRMTRRMHLLIGYHVAARNPALFVDIGDFGEWASVCRHVDNQTWKARLKPSIDEDLAAIEEHMLLLFRPMREAGVRPVCVAHDGNHEGWLYDFEDKKPETMGTYTGRLDRMLRGVGFDHHIGFGQFSFIGGVGYTHAPLNVMGRAFGGMNAESNVANSAVHDTVWGHTHLYSVGTRRKVGHQALVRSVNCGSSMPPGYCGDHAIDTMGSFIDSGLLEVWDQDGRICDHRFVPTEILEARYGHKVDAILGRTA